MPYARRTLTQLIADTAADIQTALPGADPLLRRAVLTVLGRVLAGQHHEQFGYLDWIARQAVPFTSTEEFLEGWGSLKGVTRKPASWAVFAASSSGNTPTAVVPPGAVLVRGDGATYATALGGTADIGGNLVLTDVTASVAGSASSVSTGSALSLQRPFSGVNPSFTVGALTTIAQDTETDTALLLRVLTAYRAPAQGGDLADYVGWALAVSGVTRVWVGGPTIMGAGTVSVYFAIDDAVHVNGQPSGSNGVSQFETRDTAAVGDQLVLANALYPLRPVTALVYAMAPVADALNLTLSEVPTDPTVRAAIAAAFAGFLLREASVGGTWSDDPTKPAGVIRLSHLEAAIAAVPSLDHFVLTVPAADTTAATGHIAVPGVITFA